MAFTVEREFECRVVSFQTPGFRERKMLSAYAARWEMLTMKMERFCPQIDFFVCYTAVPDFVNHGAGNMEAFYCFYSIFFPNPWIESA